MRTRSLLPALVLASMVGGVLLPAQEMPQPQIPNWSAPAFWQPAPGSSREISGARPFVTQSAISSPMPFVPINPCRMLDTRITGGPLASTIARTVTLTGPPCGIPSFAVAVSANFAVFDIITSANGVLVVYPTGSPSSSQAMVNWSPTSGQIDNASAVPLGTGGAITVSANQGGGTIDLVIDVNGYYAGAGTGPENTFLGFLAGNFTMSGDANTGIGFAALLNDTTGTSNTAIGNNALDFNTTGSFNTANGKLALVSNTTGSNNTANGNLALEFNESGSTNTAVGDSALRNLGSGIGNIAIGAGACSNNTSGNDNICIHSDGVSGESNTIRIGRFFHSATYIFGISGATVTGAPVLVSSSGRLGVMSSSRSVKDDIRDIAEESDDLMRLRPVAFRYKPEIEPTGLTQYGLIAEEVAKVYPDLVVSDRNGKPQTVRYHLINALLLNEVQKQHRTVEAQEEKINSQQAEIEKLKADLSALRTLVSQH